MLKLLKKIYNYFFYKIDVYKEEYEEDEYNQYQQILYNLKNN